MRRYSTGQFARRASVSVRTLRFYDRVGVLVPPERTAAGYRLYSDAEFPRLQQVLVLKLLGLSLQEIKRCLAAGPEQLRESLSRQKAMLREKRSQLDAILQAIDEVERRLAAGEPSVESIVHVVEVIQMHEHTEWTRKYFTPDQRQKLHELSEQSYSETARQRLAARGPWTEEDQLRVDEQWAEVGGELKRLVAAGADPAGLEARAWVGRFNNLVASFTQNDPELEAGLHTWWQKHDQLPESERPMGTKYSPDEQQFMHRALEAARTGSPQR